MYLPKWFIILVCVWSILVNYSDAKTNLITFLNWIQ